MASTSVRPHGSELGRMVDGVAPPSMAASRCGVGALGRNLSVLTVAPVRTRRIVRAMFTS